MTPLPERSTLQIWDWRPDIAVTRPDADIVHLLELDRSSIVPCRKCGATLAWVMVAGSFDFADCKQCGTPYTPQQGPKPWCRRCGRELEMVNNGAVSWLTCPPCVSEYHEHDVRRKLVTTVGHLDGQAYFRGKR